MHSADDPPVKQKPVINEAVEERVKIDVKTKQFIKWSPEGVPLDEDEDPMTDSGEKGKPVVHVAFEKVITVLNLDGK